MFRESFNGRCLATLLTPAMVRIILIFRLWPQDAHSPPSSRFTRLTQAIEQCQKGTADLPGNPNCTAIYGSGTLSSVLDHSMDKFHSYSRVPPSSLSTMRSYIHGSHHRSSIPVIHPLHPLRSQTGQDSVPSSSNFGPLPYVVSTCGSYLDGR